MEVNQEFLGRKQSQNFDHLFKGKQEMDESRFMFGTEKIQK